MIYSAQHSSIFLWFKIVSFSIVKFKLTIDKKICLRIIRKSLALEKFIQNISSYIAFLNFQNADISMHSCSIYTKEVRLRINADGEKQIAYNKDRTNKKGIISYSSVHQMLSLLESLETH